MKRIPSLDGVRAIAISMVVMGHWFESQYHWAIAGAYASLGRRIFFVLSGYLITMLLMKQHSKSSTIGLREFYVRRAYRILPGALAFILPVFAIFWHELRWYHMAAAVLYVVNFDFGHPWFLGHLWSISVQEQFYLLWPWTIKKWYRLRVAIPVAVIAIAPVFRVACHFAGLHGKADETFPAVADILAIGGLLALFESRLPIVRRWWALGMMVPVALVPMYMAVLRFHTTVLLLFVLWPVMHLSIAGLVLHVVRRPYRILNVEPVMWLGRISYGLYLWQQLFAFGEQRRPWYSMLIAVGVAACSYYLVEQPMLRVRERKVAARAATRAYAAAA